MVLTLQILNTCNIKEKLIDIKKIKNKREKIKKKYYIK
jgi:hypothetical protein